MRDLSKKLIRCRETACLQAKEAAEYTGKKHMVVWVSWYYRPLYLELLGYRVMQRLRPIKGHAVGVDVSFLPDGTFIREDD